ncbi:hypothetical protein [Pseudanabaena sp. 'Roaring Creek']|uniref:hypothetical protein n=1 Tax=Pseudanabaena sp. 'Roaring Creek' TaxID=1681830 RepID=UPI0006D7A2F1|nr:hypothetical protein [Pseudanabaena sp. 'Roaring Creek']
MSDSVSNAAQGLAAKMGGAAVADAPKAKDKDTTQSKPKDYGFKGYWDDAIYGALFRIFGLAIAFALLRFIFPLNAVQWLGWGGSLGLWIALRIKDCRQPFGLTNWAIAIYIAVTIHDTFWNWSNP